MEQLTKDFLDLRNKSRSLVERIHVADHLPASCLSDDQVHALSEQTEVDLLWKARHDYDHDGQQDHSYIVWVEACLRNLRGVRRTEHALDFAKHIRRWVAEQILPSREFSHFPSTVPDSQDTFRSLDQIKSRLRGLAGLRLLSSLYSVFPSLKADNPTEILIAYIAFTDIEDPWTLHDAQAIATSLLEKHDVTASSSIEQAPEVVIAILAEHIRPEFRMSVPVSITTQGRKAAYVRPLDPVLSKQIDLEESWKSRRPYIVTLLKWSLKQLNNHSVSTAWTLVVPAVMILLDDSTSSYKVQGCKLVQELLAKTTKDLLYRTGLGNVLEDTLLTDLLYLPPATEEQESLLVLENAYDTLLALITIEYPQSACKDAVRAYGNVMGKGIIHGCAQAGENVKVAELLMRKTSIVVSRLGIHCVKYFKDLVPAVTSPLVDPFVYSYPPLILSCLEALQEMMLNGWPRMDMYKGDILKAICICWCRGNEDVVVPVEGRIQVLDRLRVSAKVLVASLSNSQEAVTEVIQLFRNNKQLEGLLPDG